MMLFVLILHAICLLGFSRETSSLLRDTDTTQYFNNTCLPSRKIIAGNKATLGQFPYIAILKYGREFWCAGSIIHRNWVLTAAHCIVTSRLNEAIIVVGTTTHAGFVYRVEKFIIQDGFTHIPEEQNHGLEYVIHDIALVRLQQSIRFNQYISSVQLSVEDTDLRTDYVWAVIPGWGSTKFKNDVSPNLNYITVYLLPEKVCQKFGWTYATYPHICTSTQAGKSACYGDSGGPVVLVKERLQVGIVSTADKYCQCLKPNLHTRVSNYIGWIQSYMKLYNDNL